MEQVPRQQYTKEFREQAVRLVLEQQVTIPEAARRLAMSGSSPRWGRADDPSRSWKQSYPGSSGISLRPGWSATS